MYLVQSIPNIHAVWNSVLCKLQTLNFEIQFSASKSINELIRCLDIRNRAKLGLCYVLYIPWENQFAQWHWCFILYWSMKNIFSGNRIWTVVINKLLYSLPAIIACTFTFIQTIVRICVWALCFYYLLLTHEKSCFRHDHMTTSFFKKLGPHY